MSLKNIMPDNEPIKMQEGTTLPFARQQGATSPRAGGLLDRQGRILLPDDTGPTIGLPGQQPIDDLNRFQPVGDPIPFDPEKERLKKELEKAQQVQTNIDPNVPMGIAFNQDHFDAGIAKTNLSPAEIANLSPAMRESIQLYGDPENVGGPELVDKFLGTVTKGISKAVPGIGFISKAAQVATNMQEGKPIFSKPETQAFPAKLTRTAIGTADPLKTKTTDPFASSRALYRSPGATAPAVTLATVGSELFGDDPTYAGGAKEGKDGLYATGGSGSFTSMAHYNAGISQLDESNIVAQGINSGSFTNTQEGRGTIDDLIESGYGETEINDIVNTGTTVSAINTQAKEFAASYGQQGKKEEAPQIDVDASPKVICAELYRQGLLEKEIFELDEEFGRHLRKVDPDIINGYHQWALPLVSLMQRSIVASHIIKIIAKPVVKHIAYQMGYPSKTYLGATMFTVGKHICRFIAKKDVAHA